MKGDTVSRQPKPIDVSAIDTALILTAHALVFLLSAINFIRSVTLRRTWMGDCVALGVATFNLFLLLEVLRMTLYKEPLDTQLSVVLIVIFFFVQWTLKASVVLLSAKMLHICSLRGVRNWIVGVVLVMAGLAYAVTAAATCVQTSEQGTGVVYYSCHPPTLLVASSMASGVIVDLYIVGLFYDILLEGFAFSIRSMSSHKLASISMITAVLLTSVFYVILTVQYLAQDNAGGAYMLRLVNISPAISILSLVVPSFFLSSIVKPVIRRGSQDNC